MVYFKAIPYLDYSLLYIPILVFIAITVVFLLKRKGYLNSVLGWRFNILSIIGLFIYFLGTYYSYSYFFSVNYPLYEISKSGSVHSISGVVSDYNFNHRTMRESFSVGQVGFSYSGNENLFFFKNQNRHDNIIINGINVEIEFIPFNGVNYITQIRLINHE